MKEFLTKSWVRTLVFGLIIATAVVFGFGLIAVEMTENRAQELALAHEKQCLELVKQEREREQKEFDAQVYSIEVRYDEPEFVYSSNTDSCIYVKKFRTKLAEKKEIKDLFTNVYYAKAAWYFDGQNYENDIKVFDNIYHTYFYELRPL